MDALADTDVAEAMHASWLQGLIAKSGGRL